jgi:hypothetical protein
VNGGWNAGLARIYDSDTVPLAPSKIGHVSSEGRHAVTGPRAQRAGRVLALFLMISQVGLGQVDAALADGSCPLWRAVPSPAPVNANLSGVSAVSSTDIWAVGSWGETPISEHWDGARWSPVKPEGKKGYLTGVCAVASSDVWAVGYIPGPDVFEPLAQHWDGTAWATVPTPTPGSYHYLADAGGTSSTDLWAVGHYTADNGEIHGLALHWDGSAWDRVPVPDTGIGANILLGVWAVAPGDVWAAGYYEPQAGQTQPLVDHWDGTAWSGASPPPPSGEINMLNDIAASSPADVWAVGFYGPDSPLPLAEHWDGSTWTLIDAPGPHGLSNKLFGVWATSSDDAWAVGDSTTSDLETHPLTEHWDGNA